jgi:23S rRNA (cytidine2498-2'-O)-methyltransferase
MVLASASCSSPFPNGEVCFIEDRTAPSRAYLSLWELFTLIVERPRPNQPCLDLGSSPGGWTWVLQRLGAHVISVDKAPLDRSLTNLPGIAYHRENAFALEPRAVGQIDWLFSDIICYPRRLLRLVQKCDSRSSSSWCHSGPGWARRRWLQRSSSGRRSR